MICEASNVLTELSESSSWVSFNAEMAVLFRSLLAFPVIWLRFFDLTAALLDSDASNRLDGPCDRRSYGIGGDSHRKLPK